MTARVLGLITARGGSRGLPDKHLRPLAGRPLLAWTVAAARAAPSLDRLVLSSDDEAIMAAARDAGCEVPFRRDPALAQDLTPHPPVILDVLARLEEAGDRFTHLVLLQPTSPLRAAADIEGAVALCQQTGAPVVGVCPTEKPPAWMVTLDVEARMVALTGRGGGVRQQEPPAYQLNGAVFVAEVAWYRRHQTFLTAETRAWVMPRSRSIDVDTALDLAVAEAVVAAGLDRAVTPP